MIQKKKVLLVGGKGIGSDDALNISRFLSEDPFIESNPAAGLPGGDFTGDEILLFLSTGASASGMPNYWYIRFPSYPDKDFKKVLLSAWMNGDPCIQVDLFEHSEGKISRLASIVLPIILHSLSKTRETLFREIAWMIRRSIQHKIKHILIPCPEQAPAEIRPFRGPILLPFYRLARRTSHLLTKLIYTDVWNVARIKMPLSEWLHAIPSEPEWLPEPKGSSFRADPFGLPRSDYFLYEYYNALHKKGEIRRRSWSSPKQEQRLETGPTHVSYPYVFSHEEQLYCLPETSQANELFLSKISEEGELIETKTLMKGIALADPSLFFHEGVFWLWATDTRDKGADLRLNLYFSNQLEGKWTDHPLNPVKTDIRHSRPGGTVFMHENRIYRLAQDSSGGYGSALWIMEIIRLSQSEYEEIPVRKIEPLPPYLGGIHTLSKQGDSCFIDGKRKKVTFRAVFRK